ncbi:hypothetical protein [Fusibacter sp. 3D3]|uniref:hypothetical protein n=1 Tax=Fusibacter sp. 3D3 TaxID=1048380 RepID=UPI000853E0D7|nr:hypothetical protein [Fusibacter sp. 3D3]GAU76734.1 hypothetical protein F3D3_1331 [Fusibacter sp. 3D3]
MARTKTTKSIDAKIVEIEEKLRKLKERGDKVATELDELYVEKQKHENEELLATIQNSLF